MREIYGDGSCTWEELWEIFGDGRGLRTKKGCGIVGLSGLLEDPRMLRLVFDDSGQGGAGTQVQGSGLKVRIPGLGLVPG